MKTPKSGTVTFCAPAELFQLITQAAKANRRPVGHEAIIRLAASFSVEPNIRPVGRQPNEPRESHGESREQPKASLE